MQFKTKQLMRALYELVLDRNLISHVLLQLVMQLPTPRTSTVDCINGILSFVHNESEIKQC